MEHIYINIIMNYKVRNNDYSSFYLIDFIEHVFYNDIGDYIEQIYNAY